MRGDAMLFDSWAGLLRVLVVGLLAYVALVAVVRVSGKRSLSKMNAFDLVVTVALGSCLATILLSRDVALAEGVLAIVLLIALQRLVAWASVRSDQAQALVKSTPSLLLHRGRLLHEAMRRERVTEEEILAALRAHGLARVEDAGAVVLETDGTLAVLEGPLPAVPEEATALASVRGWRPASPPQAR